MTTAEKLVRIAENEPKVYEAGRKEGMSFVADNVGNALKGSASGEAVALKDVSPLEHNLRVRVESKNLAANVWSAHGDNTILENGIVTQIEADTYETIYLKAQVYQDTTLISGADVLSMTSIGIHSISFAKATAGNTLMFGINGRARDTVIRIDITDLPEGVYTVSANFTNLTQGSISWCDIMLNKGTTASPYTPPISDLSAVKLLVQGANIFKYTSYWSDTCTYENGVVTQTITDTATILLIRVKDGAYGNLGSSDVITSTGRFSFPFVCNKEEKNIYIVLNGSQGDTAIIFCDVNLPVGTYVFSADLTNMTQGSISWKDMQIALIDTDYEPYKEPIEYAQGEDIKSIAPCTTIMTDTEGALITVGYNRDINEAFAELQKVIAQLGG